MFQCLPEMQRSGKAPGVGNSLTAQDLLDRGQKWLACLTPFFKESERKEAGCQHRLFFSGPSLGSPSAIGRTNTCPRRLSRKAKLRWLFCIRENSPQRSHTTLCRVMGPVHPRISPSKSLLRFADQIVFLCKGPVLKARAELDGMP
jgi:hypothetical protein